MKYVDKETFYEFVKDLYGYNAGAQTIYKNSENITVAICYNSANIKYCIKED